MAEVKRVLVVDDHFEVLEFLQSMLELSSEHYEVVAVPSAEEGLLELRQNPFDLLITDVRLPGMSGFDLIQRVQRLKPDLPTIMITAYSSEAGRREAAELGVFRYFEKPLDTDEMLTAVHLALYGELIVHADSPADPAVVDLNIPEAVARRLETLRTDTSATRLALATVTGQLLVQVGRGHGLNLPTLAALMARNMEDSFLLARELGGESPTTIQYHAGDRTELYIANVGQGYFLALFFDAQARRGRMGTIWVFAQRAIKDLLEMLPAHKTDARTEQQPRSSARPKPTPAAAAEPLTLTPANPGQEIGAAELSSEATEPEAAILEPSAPSEGDGYFTLDGGDSSDPDEVDDSWQEAALSEDSAVARSGSLSLADAQRQGLVPADLGQTPDSVDSGGGAATEVTVGELKDLLESANDVSEEPGDLGGTWDATAGEEYLEESKGLSFEEAQRRGLISKELAKTFAHGGDGDEAVASPHSSTDKKETPPFLRSPDEAVDVDAFWEQAVAEDETNGDTRVGGLSLAEAKRKGLVSEEIELDPPDNDGPD